MKNIFVRVIATIMALVLCLAFVACTKDEKKETSAENKTIAKDSATKDSIDKTEEPTDSSKRTPRSIAEDVVKIMWVEFDAVKAYGLMHEAAINKTCEVIELSREEYTALLQESLDEIKKEMKESDGSIKWTILKENPLDQERLTELKALYSEIELEIEDVSVVMVENKVYEGEEELGYYIQEITSAKIDGEWYLVDFGSM